jgi:hypothetical protein
MFAVFSKYWMQVCSLNFPNFAPLAGLEVLTVTDKESNFLSYISLSLDRNSSILRVK